MVSVDVFPRSSGSRVRACGWLPHDFSNSPSVSLAILWSLQTPWCDLELSSFVSSLSSLVFGPLGLPILVLDLMPFRLCSSCSCLPPDTPSALLPPFGHGCISACGDGYCCFLLVRWFPSSRLNPLPRGDSASSFVFSSSDVCCFS